MRILTIVFTFVVILLSSGLIQAEANLDEKTEIPLTNPSRIADIEVKVTMGSVFVGGYSGKTILAETKRSLKGEDDFDVDVDADDDQDEKSRGMFVIDNNSSGLSIIEENNKIVIRTRRFNTGFDLYLKVPFKSNLNIKAVLGRAIVVKNINGNVTARNSNGSIRLENISGTAMANTQNGDVSVSFDRINLSNPMSFTTINGDVDVTFPVNASFNLIMKTINGKIYSDYKLKILDTHVTKKKKENKKKGKYQISFGKNMRAELNGGGKKITLKTINGSIYIRKQKK
jgi:DUF4097 and DUF4098 domain-containing protein YvlB